MLQVFYERVARGAEGEVFRGQLHGHLGDVAIKKANQLAAAIYDEEANVWDEREVRNLFVA